MSDLSDLLGFDPDDPYSVAGTVTGAIDLSGYVKPDMAKGATCEHRVPSIIGAMLHKSLMSKGAGHKYIRRVPSGNSRRPWKYFYAVTGGKGLGHHDEMTVGAKFAIKDQGKAGHFEVMHEHEDGHLTIKHDESGTEHKIHKDALAAMLHNEHAEAVKTSDADKKVKQAAAKARALKDLADARGAGAVKHAERLKKEAVLNGASEDEVATEAERKAKEVPAKAEAVVKKSPPDGYDRYSGSDVRGRFQDMVERAKDKGLHVKESKHAIHVSDAPLGEHRAAIRLGKDNERVSFLPSPREHWDSPQEEARGQAANAKVKEHWDAFKHDVSRAGYDERQTKHKAMRAETEAKEKAARAAKEAARASKEAEKPNGDWTSKLTDAQEKFKEGGGKFVGDEKAKTAETSARKPKPVSEQLEEKRSAKMGEGFYNITNGVTGRPSVKHASEVTANDNPTVMHGTYDEAHKSAVSAQESRIQQAQRLLDGKASFGELGPDERKKVEARMADEKAHLAALHAGKAKRESAVSANDNASKPAEKPEHPDTWSGGALRTDEQLAAKKVYGKDEINTLAGRSSKQRASYHDEVASNHRRMADDADRSDNPNRNPELSQANHSAYLAHKNAANAYRSGDKAASSMTESALAATDAAEPKTGPAKTGPAKAEVETAKPEASKAEAPKPTHADLVNNAKDTYNLTDAEADKVHARSLKGGADKHVAAGNHDEAHAAVKQAVKDHLTLSQDRGMSPSKAKSYMDKHEVLAAKKSVKKAFGSSFLEAFKTLSKGG